MGRSENRQRTELTAVRLLPQERLELDEAAKNRGVSVGEFLRQALRNELRLR
jgi:predicted DNA-binding protein (UPF0251 family)